MEGSDLTLRLAARWREALAGRGTQAGSATARRWSASAMIVAVAAGIAFPFAVGGAYNLQLAGDALAMGTWVMGLDILVGFTGLVSFGHAAWLAVGAYAFGYLCQHGWDAVSALAATAAIAAALSLPLGFVATRTSGLAFAIVTLAEGVIVYTVILHLGFLGGGIGLFGVPLPRIAGLTLLGSERSLYFFALALAILGYLVSRGVIRSPVGGFIAAIRDDRVRARSIGIEVQRYEVLAFVVASVVGAIGGAAFVVMNAGIGPSQFDWSQSGLALVILIVGGSGTVYGAVVGAFIYVFASNYLTSSFATTWQVYLGGLFVALVLLMPGGAAGAVRLGSGWARRRLA
ncbi:MAG: branched-chain amino acid ABC transporter permease [Solirubrobacteraceae bacterium]